MGITDDEPAPCQASGLKAQQELSPVDLGLAEGNADSKDGAFAIKADPERDQDGTVKQLATLTYLLVTGIKDHIGTSSQGAIPPRLKLGIEPGGTLAHLGRTHRMAAKFLHDGADFAGGDSLNIHLSQSQFEGLFATDSLLKGAGVKVHLSSDLRNTELDDTQARGQSLGLI